MARKERYYIDTSVIGGCLDEEFEKASRKLLDLFARGEKTALISDITMAELSKAPHDVQKLLEDIPSDHIEEVSLDEESNGLSTSFINENVIPKKVLGRLTAHRDSDRCQGRRDNKLEFQTHRQHREDQRIQIGKYQAGIRDHGDPIPMGGGRS